MLVSPWDIQSEVEQHGGRTTSQIEVTRNGSSTKIRTSRIFRLRDFTDHSLWDGLFLKTTSWEYFSPQRIWGGIVSLAFVGGMMAFVPAILLGVSGWWRMLAYPFAGIALFGLIIMGATELEMWLWPKQTLIYRAHSNASAHSVPGGHIVFNQSSNTNGNITGEVLECLDIEDWPLIEKATPDIPPITAVGQKIGSGIGVLLLLGACLVIGAMLLAGAALFISFFSLNTFLLTVIIILLLTILSRMK